MLFSIFTSAQFRLNFDKIAFRHREEWNLKKLWKFFLLFLTEVIAWLSAKPILNSIFSHSLRIDKSTGKHRLTAQCGERQLIVGFNSNRIQLSTDRSSELNLKFNRFWMFDTSRERKMLEHFIFCTKFNSKASQGCHEFLIRKFLCSFDIRVGARETSERILKLTSNNDFSLFWELIAWNFFHPRKIHN